MTRLNATERDTTLRVGWANVRLWTLWGRPAWDEPLWERLVVAAFFFLMGIVQVFAGLTGIYFSQAIVWIGFWMVHIPIKIEDWLGVERDPDLSKRIVDPRHRLAALEEIDRSKREARRLQ